MRPRVGVQIRQPQKSASISTPASISPDKQLSSRLPQYHCNSSKSLLGIETLLGLQIGALMLIAEDSECIDDFVIDVK